MVSSKIKATLVFALVLLLRVSSAMIYKIEWNEQSLVDYESWASKKTFHVGDLILFKYNPKEDSVVRVTHKNFRSCNATNPIAVMDTGADFVSIKSTHAHLYFISGVPENCKAGQKINIRTSQPTFDHAPVPMPMIASSPAPTPTLASSSAEPSHRSKASAFVATLMLAVGVLLH